jgi:uncharacterized protein
MDLRFGLYEEDIEKIIEILCKNEKIEEAIIYGSRAKGNYKKGSDVDIALLGLSITSDDVSTVSYILNEETIMPYHFDIRNINTIRNDELIQHIQRVGITIFKR